MSNCASLQSSQEIDELSSFFSVQWQNLHILKPALLSELIENEDPSGKIQNIASLPMQRTISKIGEIVQSINGGMTALFVEGDTDCYLFETTNIISRSIEKSQNEVIVKGAKEAFNEKAIDNISLIRKHIKNENLIIEAKVVAKRSNNTVFVVYEKDLVNKELLQNVKDRLDSIDRDAIIDLGILEQFIEERPHSLFPTLLYTERPDRAVSFIEEGHIALLMENSPASLVLPTTFWALFHSPEDHYLRTPYGNFIRLLRIVALFNCSFYLFTLYSDNELPCRHDSTRFVNGHCRIKGKSAISICN